MRSSRMGPPIRCSAVLWSGGKNIFLSCLAVKDWDRADCGNPPREVFLSISSVSTNVLHRKQDWRKDHWFGKKVPDFETAIYRIDDYSLSSNATGLDETPP